MEIELIKANDFSEGSARKRAERLRVAAYCRVSTDDEDQIKSYNSMVSYYTCLLYTSCWRCQIAGKYCWQSLPPCICQASFPWRYFLYYLRLGQE